MAQRAGFAHWSCGRTPTIYEFRAFGRRVSFAGVSRRCHIDATSMDCGALSWTRPRRSLPTQRSSWTPRGRYLADYGSEGWGFESLRARKKHPLTCRDASEGMFCSCRKSLHDTETTRIEGLVISPNSATEQFDRVASDELLEQLWVYSGSRAEVIREPSCVIASLKVDSGVLCVVANMTSRRIGLVMTCRSSTIRWSTSTEVHPSWLRTVREGRLRYPRPGNRQVLRWLGVWRHRYLGAPAPVCRFATRRQCRPPQTCRPERP
jgi:hypothetical protein